MEGKQERLELFSGAENRDIGIKQAIDNADSKIEQWSDMAYRFLLEYMKTHDEFMCEEVRDASENFFAPPPSNRAWGGIMRKAANEGLLTRIRYQEVKNPKAHCAPCAVWRVN